jgi:flagellin-like hook-associated protein FlgL
MRSFVFESNRNTGFNFDIHSANTRLFQDLAQPVTDPSTLAVTKNGAPLALGVDYTLVDPDTIRFTTTGIPNVGDAIAVSHTVTTTTPVAVTRTNRGIVIHDGADKDQTLTLSISASRTQDLFRSGTPDLSTRENAQTALTRIDAAISRVTGTLAEIGAQQNRLEASRGRNQIQSQNVTASRSRMRDLDFADEIVAFTKRQILDQAGISALAQANVMPQSILQLLS